MIYQNKPISRTFLCSIIESIQMNPTEFMQNLSKGEDYEITIYHWAQNLFTEGKSIQDAISIIQERRNKVILSLPNKKEKPEQVTLAKNYQKTIAILNKLPTYLNLNDDDKRKIQVKINALIKTRLYSPTEVVTHVLKIIQYNRRNNESKRCLQPSIVKISQLQS